MPDYAHPEVLTDTQWVAGYLNVHNVRIVEVGYDLADYDSGHIPGSGAHLLEFRLRNKRQRYL